MAKSRSVDQKLDELFQAPLPEFITTRTALVAALRKQGGPAAALKTIKKPSVSAWVVNQLFFQARELWTKLEESGAALRRAYGTMGQGGAGDAARKAQKDLSHTLDQLRNKARSILKSSRQKASENILRRIETTLRALALREPDATIQAGHLVADVDPPGFESLTLAVSEKTAHGSPSKTKTKPTPHHEPKAAPSAARTKSQAAKDTAAIRAQEKAKQLAAQKQVRLAKQRVQQTLRKTQRELATRTRRLETATRKVESAQKALDNAEAAREKAAHAHKSAQLAVAQAQSVVKEI